MIDFAMMSNTNTNTRETWGPPGLRSRLQNTKEQRRLPIMPIRELPQNPNSSPSAFWVKTSLQHFVAATNFAIFLSLSQLLIILTWQSTFWFADQHSQMIRSLVGIVLNLSRKSHSVIWTVCYFVALTSFPPQSCFHPGVKSSPPRIFCHSCLLCFSSLLYFLLTGQPDIIFPLVSTHCHSALSSQAFCRACSITFMHFARKITF